MNPSVSPTRGRRSALVLPSTLVMLALGPGCGASKVPQGIELSATQAALEAQMAETARLEREVAGLKVQNEHAPAPTESLPSDVPISDPAGQMDVADAGPPAPVEEHAPVEEVEEAPIGAEELAAQTALAVLDESDPLAMTDDPWSQWRTDLGGGGSRVSADTLLITGSIDRVARALEQKNMLDIMEARLADKQRQIDQLRGPLALDAAVASGSLDPAVAQQIEQLAAGQTALAVRLQQQDAAAAAKEAEAAQAAEVANAASGARTAAESEAQAKLDQEAAAKAVADAKAEEQARWDALAMRLDSIEQGRGAATPVDGEDLSAKRKRDRKPADDPRVEALQQQLDEMQAAAAAREGDTKRADQVLDSKQLEEREATLARMEERYGRLAAQQEQALADLRDERKAQRQWWQFWRGKSDDDGVTVVSGVDDVTMQARLDAAKAENDAEWKALMDRQEQEQLDMEAERQAAAADRALMEQQIAALSARLEAADQPPTADPEQQARLAELTASVAQLSEQRDGLATRLQGLEARETARAQRMRAMLQPIVDAGIKVVVDEDRARVQLPSDVLFASGASVLAPGGLRAVDNVAATLSRVSGLRLQVEGHTDNVPFAGGKRTNWDLGFARASAVLDRMVQQGIPAGQISAASYADTRPVAANDTAAGRALNRRIEIVVLLVD